MLPSGLASCACDRLEERADGARTVPYLRLSPSSQLKPRDPGAEAIPARRLSPRVNRASRKESGT